MKSLIALAMAFVILLTLPGCVRTYSFKKERVDQELAGNRGTIMGEVPPAPIREAVPKRTVIGVDVEIPTFAATGRKRSVTQKGETTVTTPAMPTDRELWGNRGYMSPEETTSSQDTYPYKAERIEQAYIVQEEVQEIPVEKPSFTEYKVKKGDTLSTIAARSDVYGDAGKWKRIYEANKEVIKDPSRVYAGQILRIPLIEEETRQGSRVK